jgi:serine/threonine protein kinase
MHFVDIELSNSYRLRDRKKSDNNRWRVMEIDKNTVRIIFKYKTDLKFFQTQMLPIRHGMSRIFNKHGTGGGPNPFKLSVDTSREDTSHDHQSAPQQEVETKNVKGDKLGCGSSACIYWQAGSDEVNKIFFQESIDKQLDLKEHTANQEVLQILKSSDNIVIIKSDKLAPRGQIKYRLCDGETLHEILVNKTRLNSIQYKYDLFDNVRSTVSSILLKLNTNKPKAMYHCDIKPENIMLCQGIVTLIDFGVSGPECNTGTTPLYTPVDVNLNVTFADGMYYGRISSEMFAIIVNNTNNEDLGKPHDMWALGVVLLVILGKKTTEESDETYDSRFHVALDLINPVACRLLTALLRMRLK